MRVNVKRPPETLKYNTLPSENNNIQLWRCAIEMNGLLLFRKYIHSVTEE